MLLRPNFIALNSFHDLETYMSYKLVIYLVMANLKKKNTKKKKNNNNNNNKTIIGF